MYILDFDECKDRDFNKCHEYADCKNVIGTYICSCFKGFFGDGMNCEGNSVLCLKLDRVIFSSVSSMYVLYKKNRSSNSYAKTIVYDFYFPFPVLHVNLQLHLYDKYHLTENSVGCFGTKSSNF